MGLRKKTLVDKACGVYIANGICEWNHAQRAFDAGAFGATGSSLSIGAGRFSFVLGLKGPSMVLDTEASSGLTAVHMAADSTRQRNRLPTDFSVAIGVHLCLASLWWPSHCASGWLCRQGGRCFTFSASAAGYVRGEGVGALVVKPLAKVMQEKVDPTLCGCVAGSSLSSNGRSASLAAPNGPAEQEVVCEAMRNANISSFDVDGVETHGAGALLADAVEVGSMLRSHRSPEEYGNPLALLATKSSVGNQVECSGIAGLFRVLHSARLQVVPSNLHLGVCNPHIETFDQPALFPTESIEGRAPSTFIGVMARGFGGSNAFVIGFGHATNHLTSPATEAVAVETARRKEMLPSWPAGFIHPQMDA
jgi:acyl transferase domain-containing protein